jgi:hypothetical protein
MKTCAGSGFLYHRKNYTTLLFGRIAVHEKICFRLANKKAGLGTDFFVF